MLSLGGVLAWRDGQAATTTQTVGGELDQDEHRLVVGRIG